MFSHVMLGANDIEASKKFYDAALGELGIQPGRVIGRSDAHGGEPTGEAYTPPDLAATIFSALGIGPDTNFHDADGRPYHLYRGRPIEALL